MILLLIHAKKLYEINFNIELDLPYGNFKSKLIKPYRKIFFYKGAKMHASKYAKTGQNIKIGNLIF